MVEGFSVGATGTAIRDWRPNASQPLQYGPLICSPAGRDDARRCDLRSAGKLLVEVQALVSRCVFSAEAQRQSHRDGVGILEDTNHGAPWHRRITHFGGPEW